MIISYIIPVYNAEKFIVKCVNSILNQKMEDGTFEIILVNDGSKDDTEQICKNLQEEHPSISYYAKENAGPGHSRNFGLDRAKGDYIWFVDADDYLEDGVANQLLVHLEENLDLYIFGYNAIDLNGNFIYNKKYPTQIITPLEALQKEYFVNLVWCKLIKRDVLNQNQLRFREDIRGPEDFDLSFRLLSAITQIKTIDLICYNYIENPASLMQTRSEDHMQHLAEDSITAVNDLRLYMNSFDTTEKKNAFEFWLANFMYGLLLSFLRFNYSTTYVSQSLKRLAAKGNYPLKYDSRNLKRKWFTRFANAKILFLTGIKIKRALG